MLTGKDGHCFRGSAGVELKSQGLCSCQDITTSVLKLAEKDSGKCRRQVFL
jgi:hypothetical protein